MFEIPNDVVIGNWNRFGSFRVPDPAAPHPTRTKKTDASLARASVQLLEGWEGCWRPAAASSLMRPGASNVSLTLRSYLSSAGVSSPP